jgi:hypothetical protein
MVKFFVPLKDARYWWSNHKQEYIEWFQKQKGISETFIEDPEWAERELRYQGFVSMDAFERKEGFSYLISEKLKLIYPHHLGSRCSAKRGLLTSVEEPLNSAFYLNNYGLANWTSLDTSSWNENFEKYSEKQTNILRNANQ